MKIYTRTTTDKYEFPIAVADSIPELAMLIGVSENSIYSSLYKQRERKAKGIPIGEKKKLIYHEVEVEDDGEDDKGTDHGCH